MAKPQVITLPFVLLLWDYWPLRRMSLPGLGHSSAEGPPLVPAKSFYSLLEEKFPLLAIAGVNAYITMQAQGRGGARNYFPRLVRLGNAIVCYARYVGKAVWPSRLALFYPHPGTSIKTSHVLAALVLLAGRHRAGRRAVAPPLSRGGVALVPRHAGPYDWV